MKKISLLFATLLVLVSSIIFCSCDNGYKNLKIECNVERISLVLDDESLSSENVIFELSGAKSWGEISIVSSPLGLVQTNYQIEDKKCGVVVKALQPSGDGAVLIITHLGSGKSLEIPLEIGRKLQSVSSNNKDLIIEKPSTTTEGEISVKEIEIPTKQLLNCTPLNYTDNIVWQAVETELPLGVDVVSYSEVGMPVDAFVDVEVYGENRKGKSNAVKTVISVSSECANNATVTLNPISVLDGNAILYKNVKVSVSIVDLLKGEDITVTSQTHGNENDILNDLVLISNPDSDKPRSIQGLSTSYDYYSTSIIDLKLNVDNALKTLNEVNAKYAELYTIDLSSNINGLLLEGVDFGKIRVVATSTCVGQGEIIAKFMPNDCVGDVIEFSITIPCLVGERATSFSASSNGNAIAIKQDDNYTFSSITPLNDANALGQEFRFDVLSTNTLSALKSYKITINANLLYINPELVDEKTHTSQYIRNSDDSGYMDLTKILNEKYEYQISLLKDGKEIKFYYNETNNTFVSEVLSNRNSIYIKWLKNDNGSSIADADFGISISNCYDERYDIDFADPINANFNNGFENTVITYNLAFNRQRTVESITYSPVMVTYNSGWTFEYADDMEQDWKFYFEPTMFDATTTFYGIYVSQVLGINNTMLTADELKNINLEIAINGQSLGFALFDITSVDTTKLGGGFEYVEPYIFNFDSSSSSLKNIVIIGKTGLSGLNYGDYEISISQNNKEISIRDVRVYKNLDESSITVSVPNADFRGEYLNYEKLTQKPDDWSTNYTSYYEYAGGRYVSVESAEWNKNKAYYQYVDIVIDNGSKIIDANDMYILSTSKQYNVNIEISNKDFVDASEPQVKADVVANLGAVLATDVSKMCGTDSQGNNIISTGLTGTYNTITNEKNYIRITYTVSAKTYDYYKENLGAETSIQKQIYVYIYEPLTFAEFDEPSITKYNINSISNTQFKQEYGTQTLNIELNDETVFDYIDVQWTVGGDGIASCNVLSKSSAVYTFNVLNNVTINSSIIATLTQFGVQYPIYCGYTVKQPILSERVVLNNATHSFESSNAYISLKVGESIDINASELSSQGEVSLKGLEYIICSTTGYGVDSVATIDTNGKLTAINSGRVKLIIVAKDRIKADLSGVTNYFKTSQYVENDSYVMIDVLVADGSKDYPYLIADSNSFKSIAEDIAKGNNDKHYALINDIDLNGVAVSFDSFKGTISSFKEDETSTNRFKIYGIMLNESNPYLFKQLELRDDGIANLQNIDLYIDINYLATKVNKDNQDILLNTLIGLVGTNSGKIDDITVTISGTIDANGLQNRYTIGSICAINLGTINIDNPTLVGVQGDILVKNSTLSIVVLGGVIGANEGELIGANIESTANSVDGDVEYAVYYDTQGATVDVVLQVQGVNINEISKSALGGVVGENKGAIRDVYATGKVLGTDATGNLVVSNVGGLIGKNSSNNTISTTITTNTLGTAISKVEFAQDAVFQIANSYSSAQVMGNQNVGGAVGYDFRGSYQKVYYEIYYVQTSVQGNTNVGGLIGYAEDSNLYYCYANSFAWNYANSVTVYDIVGNTNVGGLIGLGQSSRDNGFVNNYNYSAMNVVSSLASVSINSSSEASGLIGRLNNYGAIYTAYYYGVIGAPSQNPITKIYKDNNVINNIPYNNVYSIVNGESKLDASLYVGTGFNQNEQYNNNNPYIVYTTEENRETNLVSIIPTIIQINLALSDTYYNDSNSNIFKQNDDYGDYIKVDGKMVVYDPSNEAHQGIKTKYTLMASVVETGDTTGNLSDYKEKALVLYYYQFSDMASENALSDLYKLNTIDMHHIINDKGVVVLPNTFKRFNLRSDNNSVVSVLSGGKLLLKNEGQATITLISTLNPNAKASFVVIVRTKVLEFNMYSNANLREEYNINNTTINIVKGASKLIYADYSSVVKVYNRVYDYVPATNMEIDFSISHPTINGENIKDYIKLNGTYNADTKIYTIPYGTPITISVNEYMEGEFTITATPYVIVDYVNGDYSSKVRVALTDYYDIQFNVATKKGASAINTDKTQIDMMPADEASNLNVKISTDVQVDTLKLEVTAIGEANNSVQYNFVEMIDILHNSNKLVFSEIDDNGKVSSNFDISSIIFDNDKMLQELSLSVKLNEKSHYVDTPFRLQIKLIVENNGKQIYTILHIDVKPQTITSLVALNYRMEDGKTNLSFDNAYLSQLMRPGSTNIITIDLAPNIAVYDYVEIVDTTTQDKILFQQVNSDLSSTNNMDTWVDNGIKLTKYERETSKLYVIARLPLLATANITHTLKISVYDKDGNVLTTTNLNLEAVMYPTVVMTYAYPNGDTVTADTRYGNAQQEMTAYADLALGVEAGINITTYNIDEGSLQSYITIKDASGNSVDNDGLVTLSNDYGMYTLRFNASKKDVLDTLVGKNIEVTFIASKQLNGITETCKATISFNIRRIVVHSVSMYHTDRNGNLYGDWDEEFTTYFYFDNTDISYYNNGYWNIKYTLENTAGSSDENLIAINNILQGLNTLGTNGVNIYLASKNETNVDNMTLLDSDYNQGGISIANTNNSFVIKASKTSNISDMKLKVEFKLEYNTQNYPRIDDDDEGNKIITNELGFNLTDKTTPFDEYLSVSSQEDFENMLEGKYYRLTTDLTFTNYTQINTAIGGFTGDGHAITIESFNESQLIQDYIVSGVNLGLFGVLAEDSVIQNLVVEYDDIIINLNDSASIQQQHTNSIYFGGIAGQNLGVITNVKVVGSFTLKAQYISAELINMGGITAVNGASAGKVATITGSTVELKMSAMALIGGVSGTNYGKITNTNFKGSITSKDTNEYASNILTAGFVVNNISNAYISLSYVESEDANNSIHSVGRTAGFVFSNAGTISNAYINNISIGSQGNIGGFVYQNTGSITNCYAYATLGSSLFYQEFIHSTENTGKIANSYVITDNKQNINVSGLVSIKIKDIAVQSEYNGFIFASNLDGVWTIADDGPKLLNAGFNANYKEYDNIYNIYDVVTFEGFLDTISREGVIEGKTIRIVRDIDFSEISLERNPITFNKILLSSIEGNDMTLSNYDINNTGDVANIGLFATIGSMGTEMYVRNLILKPNSIKASGSTAVGALAGVIDSANVYNITVDNQGLMILGKNAVGGVAGIIKGDFEVFGLTSNVSAFATYNHNFATQYNLYTGKNVTGNWAVDNIDEVSYVGAVAGIVNAYNYASMDGADRNIDAYFTIGNITVSGDLVLVGETVGGAFGLIGERTLAKDINYNLASETLYQAVYVAGGLVGENRGIIQNANIVAYDTSSKQSVDTSNCFNGLARVNGGIVGLNIGGLVNSCSSDITIYTNKDFATVGGIVGRNIEGSIYNCSVSGSLDGFFVGGISGTDYSYSIIYNQNQGFGTATLSTKKVYNNVRNSVKYTNCVDNFEEGALYSNNTVTSQFITKFVVKKNNYYSFNTAYVSNPLNNLVSAKAVYGLVVGFTDRTFNALNRVEYNNKNLVVGLKIANEMIDRSEYTLTYNNEQYNIRPIISIEDSTFDLNVSVPSGSSEVLLLYLIAFDGNSSYESWSSVSGYTQQYIAIGNQKLTPSA